ncbi:MAG TPA: hypothetical protein VFW42_07855 [Fluviicoccus sp.]|nr:hypothetical protein [Fluviicoccus sp.]
MTTIRAIAAVHDALKPLVNNRVWTHHAAEGCTDVQPYIVITPISADRLTDYQGFTGHAQARIRVDIYHDQLAKLMTLGEAVVNAIDALTSVCATVQSDIDDYDETVRIYLKSIDFTIWEQTQS